MNKTRNHLAFNERWLVVRQPHRIDTFALSAQLYDCHHTLKAPFSLFPWRRRQFGSVGLHGNTMWTFLHGKRSVVTIGRYSLMEHGIVPGSAFESRDEEWQLKEIYLYAIGPHQVLIEEDSLREWAVMRERVYHHDLVVVGLPYLSSYAVVNSDGIPYPIMHDRTHLLILNPNLEVVFRHDFRQPIRDAAVDRWQRLTCCLLDEYVLVVHINTGRVVQEIPLGTRAFRVVWAQDGLIGVYSPEKAVVHIFTSTGMPVDRVMGQMLISDRGVAVLQGDALLLYSARGIQHLKIKPNEPPIGVFETPGSWLTLTLPS